MARAWSGCRRALTPSYLFLRGLSVPLRVSSRSLARPPARAGPSATPSRATRPSGSSPSASSACRSTWRSRPKPERRSRPAANQAEGTEVRPPGRPDLAAMARACGGLSIRALKNAVRRLVVVKRRGRVRCEDLAEAGLPSAVQAPRCSADVEVGQGGKVPVALEIDEGVTFREVMAEAGKAVTDAVLRKHGGRVADRLRDVRMAIHLSSSPTSFRTLRDLRGGPTCRRCSRCGCRSAAGWCCRRRQGRRPQCRRACSRPASPSRARPSAPWSCRRGS